MNPFNIQVELLKGDDPIGLPEDFDGAHYDGGVYGAQLAFERGDADKVVFYIDRDGELLDIITKTRDEFDVKEMAIIIQQTESQYTL